jgi:hypothetical protein
MASNFETVRPGDVITSDLINRIIEKLLELEGKVNAAGGASAPQVITSLDPENEQAVGLKLTINGNFDTPLNGNTVTLDSTVIPASSFLQGSGANKIIFNIPSSIIVPIGTKKPVTVSVQTTTKGSGQRTGYLIRPQAQTGIPNPNPTNITAANVSLAPNQVEMGRAATIHGTNLAPNPAVAFLVMVNGAEQEIAASVTNATSTAINLMAPDVPGVTDFTPVNVSVKVTIPGAGQPATIENVTVLAP